MATVTFSKKSIEAALGKKLSAEQLDERLVMMGVGVDSIEGDTVVLEITPNRPDYLHEEGLARALRSFLGIKKGIVNYVAAKSSYEVHVDASVAKVRPHTACAVVTGIKFDDATIKGIIQYQEKLHTTFCRNRKKAAIGIYPLEAITWPIKYEARKPSDIKFQPLEAGRVMTGHQILELHPTGKAFAHLLESADKYPIFVDAKDNILSMPPIINSEQTGRVKSSTKDVFIECSGFDQRVLNQLLALVVTPFADAGGKVHEVTVKYGAKKMVTPSLAPATMSFNVQHANALLGTNFSDAEARKLLEKMGFGNKGADVLIPPYRVDIMHERDLIEDVAIAAGYENIDAAIPQVATVAQESPKHAFNQKIVELLVGLGMLETNTFQLTSTAAQTTAMQKENVQLVELANSLNIDYNALRAWMLPSLMEVLRNNRHHDYPQRLFGIGTVFSHDKNAETGVGETEALSIVTTHPSANYTEIRQLAEYVLDKLGIVYVIKESSHASFIPGRVAQIEVDKKVIGTIGEVHPAVVRNWELEQPVAAAELDLAQVFAIIKKN
jgi:phenylalanyl-tRNA synthetase beta chain